MATKVNKPQRPSVTMATAALSFTLLSCLLLQTLSAPLTDDGESTLVRVTRQAPPPGSINFPNSIDDGNDTFPVRIAGGRDALQPSVGALSSSSKLSVNNRNVRPPPILFGSSLNKNNQSFNNRRRFQSNPWRRRFRRF